MSQFRPSHVTGFRTALHHLSAPQEGKREKEALCPCIHPAKANLLATAVSNLTCVELCCFSTPNLWRSVNDACTE
jgi:hypothetical protein